MWLVLVKPLWCTESLECPRQGLSNPLVLDWVVYPIGFAKTQNRASGRTAQLRLLLDIGPSPKSISMCLGENEFPVGVGT